MFEIVLAEYGLDHVYIREHWTMAALTLYIARREDRITRENDAITEARSSGSRAPGERQRKVQGRAFAERHASKRNVRPMRKRSERGTA
jgi:hypothetical protein